MGLILVSALVFGPSIYGPGVYAPPDVPRTHWAFKAVDGLFQEGLLKGYPSPTPPDLKMPADSEFDRTWLEARMLAWRTQGILVETSGSNCGPSRDEISRYELAVMLFSTCVNMNHILANRESQERTLRHINAAASDVVRGMAMLKTELTDLNVDLDEMLAEFNRNLKLQHQRFEAP
ncbi:hypothetical protein EON79_08505 [bacterium]|nr:MAG: hypothetical protein EON79_08505 [bacterium]